MSTTKIDLARLRSGGDPVRPLRILVTGSRGWTDETTIRHALAQALSTYATVGTPVLVHGGAPGADTLAEREWNRLAEHVPGGLSIEVHRVDSDRWARDGRSAGPARNAEMVASGATVCLAFILNGSRGATGCAAIAERASIPVIRYSVVTA